MKLNAAVSIVGVFFPVVGAIEIHGSGTTNPSKCIWDIMSKIQERAKPALRLTYRAVGSGTGIFETVGKANPAGSYTPYNDFGAGDIPITQTDYIELEEGNHGVVHLPFVVSGISFFHSVPGIENGSMGLNMTSCLLAKVFKGDILTWDDDEITSINPYLASNMPAERKITVAHRWEGSSSTQSITQYLHLDCEEHWEEGRVDKRGSTISWSPNAVGDNSCDSSGKMTNCISDTPGTIGYLDSGHGWEENLKEIELENKFGKMLSSKYSFENGGMNAAANIALENIPAYNEDFSTVSLLDMEGENVWPILVMSYVYVRTNIVNYVTDQEDRYLLKAFLKAIYEPEYIDECKSLYFTPVPNQVKTRALQAIDIFLGFPADETDEYTFEEDIVKGDGQGDKVLASRRRAFGEYRREKINSDAGRLEAQILELEKSIVMLGEIRYMEERTDNRVTASLVLASMSFSFWCATFLYFVMRKGLNV